MEQSVDNTAIYNGITNLSGMKLSFKHLLIKSISGHYSQHMDPSRNIRNL